LSTDSLLVFTGGVGGAKLCLGLLRTQPPDSLHIAVNTGDDFEHLGLYVCPDIDTTLYTLAGLANLELGWGRKDETWSFMHALEALGGETWFKLGDGDLAMHVERTRRLRAGETLTGVTKAAAGRFGIRAEVAPASDDPIRTMVGTPDGELAFQDYFVRQRCAPLIKSLRFEGADAARISAPLMLALDAPSLRGIIIAPSNPYLSIDPILAIPGMRAQMRRAGVPIVAVSPIIGNQAVKGPTAKIMRELGIEPSPLGVLEHYGDLIDGFVLDQKDASLAGAAGKPVQVCDTLMQTLEDRDRVARSAAGLVNQLR
jgi:LPPG:FO 2-phospho-L-lactate transferase